jgi:DNA-binding transcriptional LysR family regulator
MKSLNSLKGISSFVAVASAGSFTAAAKLQGVTAVAVGKNVATLEAHMGVRLFQRTTRTLRLTAEGEIFYAQCLEPLRALEAAQLSAQTSTKARAGLVRITCAAAFGAGFIVPLMPEFHAAYPHIHIELHLDDNVNDMVLDGYDVGLRIGRLNDSALIARPIAPLPFVVCASPGYLKRCGVPRVPADLARHNCLRMRRARNAAAMPWLLRDAGPDFSATLTGNFFVNDFSALVAAGVQGQGLVNAPLPLVMPLFRAGQLQPVLTEHIEPRLTVYLYFLNRKNLPARTRCVIDFILARLGTSPDLQTPHQALVAPFLLSVP